MSSALGLAVCKGAHLGSPRTAWQSKCPSYKFCPKCESDKASVKGARIAKKLRHVVEYVDGDCEIGVLTLTLPGIKHHSGIREKSLEEQYDYLTERVHLPKTSGKWSFRGINKFLSDQGVIGGVHFLEFTRKRKWWNLHTHTLFVSWTKLDLPQTSYTSFVGANGRELLGTKVNDGRQNKQLSKLGMGPRYTLDYAEDWELEQMHLYCSKVAYPTKPFKCPRAFEDEVKEFMYTRNVKLTRPFGEFQKSNLIPRSMDDRIWLDDMYRYQGANKRNQLEI